jgi:TetR/AcrR family fatty acid metabolism transcriptional regulator
VTLKSQVPTKRQQQAQQTKQHIYQVGLTLMEKKGYHGTTVGEISKAAKVSVGAFYHHFRSKEDILSQVYQDADDYFQQSVRHQLTASSTAEKIVEFFRYYADYNIHVGLDTTKVLYHAENTWFVKKNRGMLQLLQEIIVQGQANGEIVTDVTVDYITDYLFVAARGVVFNWCMHHGQSDLNQIMQDYMQRLVTLFVQ